MILFPAIDLYEGKAVRLYKGDYSQMTVYSQNPCEIAADFVKSGCDHIHIVDLEGAKDGTCPNLETVIKIKRESSAFCEVGGGIRSMEVASKYIEAGVDRIIIGTAAIENPCFLDELIKNYSKKIAVGVDIKDGFVAIKGWKEKSSAPAFEFCKELEKKGVETIICTDISKDGAMQGTNLPLYERLSNELNINITASGGVSSLADVLNLNKMNIYGAIIGKAYYTGKINLKEAAQKIKL